MVAPKVVFQDKEILVIDKPAGLVVNRAETVRGETLQDWLEANFHFSVFNCQSCRSGLVHRLDKDTSGVILVAKDKAVFDNLTRQFRDRKVEKTYLALVHGRLEPRTGLMRLPLSRSQADRKKFAVERKGRQSETGWRVLHYYSLAEEVFSLLELYPKTGRTHQLRVHLKHIRHPIAGDSKYLGKRRARRDAKWIKRQFLHAKQICVFRHGAKQCFKVGLAADLKEALGKLRAS